MIARIKFFFLSAILIFGGCVFVVGWFLFFQPSRLVVSPVEIVESEPIEQEPVLLPEVVRETAADPQETRPVSVFISDVPFTVQAPFAQWDNPVFQDACEEASLLMVNAWVDGMILTKEAATQQIADLALYQKTRFGHSVDTSIEDTAFLLREYFGIKSGEVQTVITSEDIRDALASSRIVLIPTDGRALKNPNFTPPGPARHMVVIVGYDAITQEFIVNDPGTRKGEGYRYPEAVLFDAILDYPTGNHLPVTSTDTVMLTVSK